MDPGGIGGRTTLMPAPVLSVVMPVFKEGEAVEPVLRSLDAAITASHEILVVYDFDEDPTVPVIDRLSAELPAIRGLRNDLGRGVLNAMKAGIAESAGAYVLISMADGSDEPHVVDPMVALALDGADVVSASRYMRGGHQVGGPPLKRLMSRTAGLTLHWFAGVPTHDPTNNFKLYSRRFLESVTIESTAGFELALELTVKATIARRRVAEVPTTWRDRTAGESNFKLRKWLPHYLHWYWVAFRARAVIDRPAAARPELAPRRAASGARGLVRRGSPGSRRRGQDPPAARHRPARLSVSGDPNSARTSRRRVTVRSSSFAVSGSTPGPRSPIATTIVARVCAARSANRSRPSRSSQTFQTRASVATEASPTTAASRRGPGSGSVIGPTRLAMPSSARIPDR